ncbi:hypothetical protein ACIQPR_48025 [Streptomyces sp. NPDC091280]|uniref:hypothetical protein n=1 Tax=Streptomyces sp. NPDC091280 TaxID=3365984 RepID=UPI0038049390
MPSEKLTEDLEFVVGVRAVGMVGGCPGELVPPVQAVVDCSLTPIALDRPGTFGVTVVLTEALGR